MFQRHVLTALVLAVVACGAARAQITLEWKLKEGDTFYIESTSATKLTMKTVGRELKQDVEQTTVFSVKVEKKNPDNSMGLEMKLEWLTLKSGGATPNADERYNQQLGGLAFKFTLSPRGEVTEFKGYAEAVKKIAGDDANAQKVIQSVLSEDALRQIAAEAFSFLPDKPVKTADTWERKADRPLGPLGSLLITRKFTYDAQEKVDGKDLEKLSFIGTAAYTPPRQGEPSSFPFTVVKGDIRVEQLKGAIWFDAMAGRLVKSEWDMRLKGAITIAVGGTNLDTEAVQEMSVKTRVHDKMPVRPGATPG